MKKWILIALLGTGLGLGTTLETRAGDDGWAAFGGFLGGTILANMAHHGGHHTTVHHEVVIREPVYEVEVAPAGHYEVVRKKIWNPGYYSYAHDRCGRRIKVWNEGFYTFRDVEVWVSYRGRHHGHGHHRRVHSRRYY